MCVHADSMHTHTHTYHGLLHQEWYVALVQWLLMVWWVIRSIPHGWSIELFPIHTWGNKDYGMYYPVSCVVHVKHPLLLSERKSHEGRKCFYLNDALNTFYLRLYGVGHMVKDHSDSSKRGNPRPPHRLLFLISSKASFICIIPQTG